MTVKSISAVRTEQGLVISIPGVKPGTDLANLYSPKSNRSFLQSALSDRNPFTGEIRYLSHTSVCLPNEEPEGGLMFGSVLQAWSNHAQLALSPDLCWYMITHEVANYIKANEKECAHFFTDTPGTKKKIVVRTTPATPWEERVKLFRQGFEPLLDPLVFNTFLPRFSTTDPVSEASLLVTFMDGVQAYFEYGMQLCCGIPRVQLSGTVQDWELLEKSAASLSDMFEGLRPYFRDLQGVLKTITDTVRTGQPDPEFWDSIVKQSFGSGPSIVTGWISTFVAHRRTPRGSELRDPNAFNWRANAASKDPWPKYGIDATQLPVHVNKAPFELIYPDGSKENLHLVGGVLGVSYEGQYVTPQLGLGVVKL